MANIADNIFAALLLVAFGLFVIIAFYMFGEVSKTGILGSYAADFQKFYTALNNVALFIAIGMSLAAVFSGLMIRTHPAFLFVAVILVFIEFMVVPPFLDIYNGVAQTMPANIQNGMNQQSTILQFLPILTAMGTMLTIIVGIVRD